MTKYALPASNAAFIASMRTSRKQLGWSAQRLANECAKRGMPELNRAVIANMECGRRLTVSIDEARVLLDALGEEEERRMNDWRAKAILYGPRMVPPGRGAVRRTAVSRG